MDHNINRMALILCEGVLRDEIRKLNELITTEVTRWVLFADKMMYKVCKIHEMDNKIFI